MPPLAIATTRCITCSGMPAAWAEAMNWPLSVDRAMPRPPEAEPVMPARVVVATAARTSGSGRPPSASRTARKPGSAAITAPKPNSDAVFIVASSAPAMAGRVPSMKRTRMIGNANATVSRMPHSRAASSAHTPVTAGTSVTSASLRPGRLTVSLAPNACGIRSVKTLFRTPTATSGRIATAHGTPFSSDGISGSFRWFSP